MSDLFCLIQGVTQDDEVVGVSHQHRRGPRQVHARGSRRVYRTPAASPTPCSAMLNSIGLTTPPCGVPVTGLRTSLPSITPARSIAQQLQDRLVTDPFLNRLHQLLVRNRLETVGDVRLDHPPATPPKLIDEHLQGIAGTQTNRAACRPRRSAQAPSSPPPAQPGHAPSGWTADAARQCRASE